MDLSTQIFDLRDAIEELREERAELLKRIKVLEEKKEPAKKQQQDEPENSGLDARKCVEPFPKQRDSQKGQDRHNHGGIDEDHALDQLDDFPHSGILPRGGTR
jgi:predicted nuclease with TOPRIM domain